MAVAHHDAARAAAAATACQWEPVATLSELGPGLRQQKGSSARGPGLPVLNRGGPGPGRNLKLEGPTHWHVDSEHEATRQPGSESRP
jgi:hypothetical protein